MGDAVMAAGGRIDAVNCCPHDVGCRFRKPEIGMFERAARKLGLQLDQTAMVSDRPSDVIAASRINARRIFVGSRDPGAVDYLAADSADAAAWLLRRMHDR